MNQKEKAALVEYLSEHITQNKRDKMREVLKNRTHYLTVVLEDIYQPHNASAVLRSCDVFGVQNVHVVESRNKFQVVPSVAMGASKWLDLHRYDSITASINKLKKDGYRIIATTPHTNSHYLPELPLDQKTALLFGTEQEGLTKTALQNADMFIKIPMYGFVESFNISVSVALCLYDLVHKLHKSDILWRLSDDEKNNIMLSWLRRMLKKAPELEAEFFDTISQ